ncbi:M48 family metallopeptidase [Aliidongia dinghuensis]|uniref:M48 family metallopeptidase n=1 Tax=Aliidongia dinghuensis TaxID=1867774 RepID=UPI00166CF33D|nr:SprT family zinc-dependent metalloprotease [Aliidongia dinghuensis]
MRVSPRARRMALRLHPAVDSVELVLPAGASLAVALGFLDGKRGWIAAQVARMPPRLPFVDGATIPVLGQGRELVLHELDRGRRPVFRLTQTQIEVTGDTGSLARRTRTGLAELARGMLADKTRTLARRLDKTVARVSVGDPHSRWGSCASSGNIRYSWRLILAPEPIMDYVVAHEVAHLAEMNHSQHFWRLVADLDPGHDQARAWLKRNGPQLLRYG